MRLVRYFYYKDNNNLLKQYCFNSKNLYNQALYLQRKCLKEKGKIYSYSKLDKIMKKEKNLEGKINYKLLPKAQVSQQILKLLDKNFKSFFKSIKDWKKNSKKYKSKPNPPKYLNKKDLFLLIFTNQCAKIKNKEIILTKQLKIKIPDNVYLDELKKFKQIRILPVKNQENLFKIEIIYEKECENKELNYKEYASIDLGVNNLITLIDTKGNKPLIVSGGIPKSINQCYNKKIAKLQSIKDKMKIKKRTKLMNKITLKRNNKIKDYFHKTTRLIVNYLIKNKIGNLVVGQVEDWKTQSSLGRKNNQIFQALPLQDLVKMLEYKCKLVGIKLIKVNEAYTSKCDALALEEIKKHENFLGKRIKRGLFKHYNGIQSNADVNGSINIAKKFKVDILNNLNEKILKRKICRPRKITLFQLQNANQFCNKMLLTGISGVQLGLIGQWLNHQNIKNFV